MQVDKQFIIVEDDGDPGKSDVENRLSTINVSWLFPCSKSAASASGERESNSVAGTYLGSKCNSER